MGFQFPVHIWNQLTGSEFRLLEQLAFLRPDRGWVYVSREWLATRLDLSRDQISRITSHLVQLGVLEKFQRRFRRQDGTWDTRPSCYRIAPWLLWKMRSLTKRFTGLRSAADRPKKKEKISVQTDSFLRVDKEKTLPPSTLQKIPLLNQWLARGKNISPLLCIFT